MSASFQLSVLNFYPFVQRFLQPHQRGKEKYITESINLNKLLFLSLDAKCYARLIYIENANEDSSSHN